jgi:hypothetical protein
MDFKGDKICSHRSHVFDLRTRLNEIDRGADNPASYIPNYHEAKARFRAVLCMHVNVYLRFSEVRSLSCEAFSHTVHFCALEKGNFELSSFTNTVIVRQYIMLTPGFFGVLSLSYTHYYFRFSKSWILLNIVIYCNFLTLLSHLCLTLSKYEQ